MSTPKCQVCDHPGIMVWDICNQCGWENDTDLWYYPDPGNQETVQVNQVGYQLTKFQRDLWSTANGDTPNNHYQRWLDNGRKIKYKWEE